MPFDMHTGAPVGYDWSGKVNEYLESAQTTNLQGQSAHLHKKCFNARFRAAPGVRPQEVKRVAFDCKSTPEHVPQRIGP